MTTLLLHTHLFVLSSSTMVQHQANQVWRIWKLAQMQLKALLLMAMLALKANSKVC